MSFPSALAHDRDWWRQAVVYQIYPRSFADANGDGIGDLRGIIDHADHLVRLGVDAVWLSPFYPSALADGGYDVDDYRAVAPELGTLDDLDELVSVLHDAGIRLIVDIVPKPHVQPARLVPRGPGVSARFGRARPLRDPAWQRARRERAADRLAVVLRRAGVGADRRRVTGTSTCSPRSSRTSTGRWTRSGRTSSRRCGSGRTAAWTGSGSTSRTCSSRTRPSSAGSPPTCRPRSGIKAGFPDGQHPFEGRDEVHEIYRTWRAVFDEYDPPRMAVAEAWVAAHRRVAFARPEGLGQAFNFDLLLTPWDAGEFTKVITENLALSAEAGASSTWVFSNHDMVRHVTRYAVPNGTDLVAWLRDGGHDPEPDLERGLRRARAATLLALALPGSTYVYQGEELGLPEVTDLPAEVLQDPTYARTEGAEKGRDGCRVPLPWTEAGESFGFGPGPASHLPQPEWFGAFAVDREMAEPASTLHFYIDALAARRDLQGAEELSWLTARPDVVAFERPGGWVSLTNFGEHPVPMPEGRVVIASRAVDGLELPAETTVWLQTGAA